MNKRGQLLVFAPSLLLLLSWLSFPHPEAESQVGAQNITGDAVNSIYLTITDHRYREGEYNDQITGTVTNNSTETIGLMNVYAALYNADNQLISMESGTMTVTTLPAGDNSAFDITVYGVGENNIVDHYALFPTGTPQ
jgi:hypothetical protein